MGLALPCGVPIRMVASEEASAHVACGRCLLGLTSTVQLEDPATDLAVASSRQVRDVALLRNLPEDLALSVLAHEAGHIFLHLHGHDSHTMEAHVAEGLCELWAYLWEHGRVVAGETDWQRRQRMRQMERNDDAVYGDGFRDALAAYVACGYSLSRLMARVRDTGGQLPRAAPMLAAWAARPGRSFQALGGAPTADSAVYQPVSEDGRRVDTRRRAKVFDARRRTSSSCASGGAAPRDLARGMTREAMREREAEVAC